MRRRSAPRPRREEDPRPRPAARPSPPVDPKTLRAGLGPCRRRSARRTFSPTGTSSAPSPPTTQTTTGWRLRDPAGRRLRPPRRRLGRPYGQVPHRRRRPSRGSRANAGRRGFVDLDASLGRHDWAVAYGYAEFHNPAARERVLRCGSDDGIKLWLNGKLVHENEVGRGYAPRATKCWSPSPPARAASSLKSTITQADGGSASPSPLTIRTHRACPDDPSTGGFRRRLQRVVQRVAG